MPANSCVQCGSDDCRKVSAVYNEETWSSTSHGTSTGFRWDRDRKWRPDTRNYSEQHSGASLLAKSLAPPSEPSPALLVIAAILASIFVIGIWFVSVGFIHQIVGGLFAQVLGAAFVLFVISAMFAPAEKFASSQYGRYRKHKARWEEAMRTWEALFYCGRCDIVFNPETGQAAHPRDIRTLYAL